MFDTKRELRKLRNEAWDLYVKLGTYPRARTSARGEKFILPLIQQAYRRWLRRKYKCDAPKYATWRLTRPAPTKENHDG